MENALLLKSFLHVTFIHEDFRVLSSNDIDFKFYTLKN